MGAGYAAEKAANDAKLGWRVMAQVSLGATAHQLQQSSTKGTVITKAQQRPAMQSRRKHCARPVFANP